MQTSDSNPGQQKRLFRILPLLMLVLISGLVVWLFVIRKPLAKSDPIAANAANVRGVGYMEQFDYPKAAQQFEEAASLAPNWLPARINLGMALYNSASKAEDPVLAQAITVFEQVLKEEPKNPYAHFNLGIIKKYQGQYEAAAKHFLTVTEIDPKDDRAWLYLGQADPNYLESEQAKKYFQTALNLNPYLVPARYAIASHLQTTEEEQKNLLALNEKLQLSNWEDEARPDRHSEQGRYATVISGGLTKAAELGPLPMFTEQPAWAFATLDGATAANTAGTMVRLDFNKDGKPDLLLLSAGQRDGSQCDLLLQNDNTKLQDVSVLMGLGNIASQACAVGDFDNDGWPDLALATKTGLRVLRNVEGKKWVDVTAAAGFDKWKIDCRSLCWLDLDQDGDLDLIAGGVGTDGRILVLQNVGVAPPSHADEPTPPLSVAFKPVELPLFSTVGSVLGFVALDIDGDKDVDLIVLAEGKPPVVVLNDRLMRFKDGGTLIDTTTLTGGLVLDANGDEQSDLLFTSQNQPAFLVSTKALPDANLLQRFTKGVTNSPDLLQAHRCDLDRDGRADIIGLSRDFRPIFLQGDGAGKLTNQPDLFQNGLVKFKNIRSLATAHMTGHDVPDLIVWHAQGISILAGEPNGNQSARVSFTGMRDNNNAGSGQKNLRTNTDGVGTKVIALTGSQQSMIELTTLSAGAGQSFLPLEFGVGKSNQIDVLRIRWPDCVVQAELGIPAGNPYVVRELNRKPTSCPVLITWDGSKWVYITDFLGGGAMGECGVDGSCRPPRPEESVKIEPGQFGLKDGMLTLRIAEPMDEVMYLDHVCLDVVDHPSDAVVYPDERFAVSDPQPTQKSLLFKTRVRPTNAQDHHGKDQTARILARDGKTVDQFAQRTWLGYAEEHWLELDFPKSMKDLPRNSNTYLVLAGWTDYPYPESIIAAAQAGVNMEPPILERQTADRKWEKLGDLGFPAGLPKVITVPVGNWLNGDATKFRIRTNLQIYWDEIYFGVADDTAKVLSLKPASVVLSHPGFIQEIRTDGKLPQAYDPDRYEPVAVTKWAGKLTKFGDVTELMANVDDRFVLCGPGDEVTIRFDPTTLPSIPPGWKRSYILRTFGYCKDTAPTTRTGGSVEPLPFRSMASYPPTEPNPKAHHEDSVRWHTRPAGGPSK
jgi:Tfp pilus assembly protein PilF